MKKTWMMVLTLILAVGLFSACGNKDTALNNGGEGTGADNPPVMSPQQPSQPTTNGNSTDPVQTPNESDNNEEKSQTLTVYGTDDQLMELTSYSTTITYTNETEKLSAALKALQTTYDSNHFSLWERIEFKSFELNEDGTLTLDIHIPDEARLGAGGEGFALTALTETMFQFDEVKAINLLIDGKEEESMMGHVMLDHPMTRP